MAKRNVDINGCLQLFYKGGVYVYEYKYVEATLDGFFTKGNHHEIIDKYAKEGWKLVQVLPTYYNSYGKPTDHEIIFEREIQE